MLRFRDQLTERDIGLILNYVDQEVAGGGGLIGSAANAQVNGLGSLATGAVVTVNFTSENYDDEDFWDIANPSRLTVPAGVSKIQLFVALQWGLNSTGARRFWSRINGSGFGDPGHIVQMGSTVGSNTGLLQSAVSGAIPVVEGDFFETQVSHNAGSDQTLVEAQFGIVVLK